MTAATILDDCREYPDLAVRSVLVSAAEFAEWASICWGGGRVLACQNAVLDVLRQHTRLCSLRVSDPAAWRLYRRAEGSLSAIPAEGWPPDASVRRLCESPVIGGGV